jgi:cellulose synthase/poly-beta-1,6-N-acetylglucosamine synthase-like glycosyltransferase
MSPLLILAVATAVVAALLSLDLALGMRRVPTLHDAPGATGPEGDAPAVSIVVAARDEAPHIAVAVRTLLSQDYPDLEVVAVDDRSTDGTAGLLDRLAASHARLRVLHVDALPAGWLGKNHALALGAEAASGELLLFTDADVMMAPDAVWRAVRLLQDRGADHLAVAPRIHSGSAWATAVIAVFLVLFSTVFRPWKARDPRSHHHIGIGAFNLVRAEAYRSIGGHDALALRPDDDVRLGRALKRAGFRQEAASGRDTVSVEWYDSLPAMARGLRKNSFAVVEYRLSLVIAGTLLPFLFIFWPLAALALTDGAVWWANGAVVALGLLTTGNTARGNGLPLWTAPAYPIGSVLLLGMVWAAALRAVVKGSVEWRGREYPLDELRGG